MIDKLRIRGFKGIYDSEDVSLGRINILVGRNGSGKSSLVEALQWIQESLSLGIQGATRYRFGSFAELKNRRSTNTSFYFSFSKGTLQYSLDIASYAADRRLPVVVDEQCGTGKTRAYKTWISSKRGARGAAVRSLVSGFRVRDGDELALRYLLTSKKETSLPELSAFRDAIFLRLSPTAISSPLSERKGLRSPLFSEDGSNLAAFLSSLKKSERDWVAGRVGKCLHGIRGLRLLRRDELLDFALSENMRARGGRRTFDIPSRLLSEGARRLTAIFAILAYRPAPQLLVIEEIENGLDPWTLEFVFRELCDYSADHGTQIVVTSHSTVLLDIADADDVKYVERRDGDVRITPISAFGKVKAHKAMVPSGSMYRMKYFGEGK